MMTLPIFLYGLYSGFSDKSNLLYNETMYFYFDLIFTLLPVIIYAIQDLEFSKENLIKNPKLYQDGLVGALFNNKLFLQWIFSSAIYAFLLFYISFKGMFSSL